MDDRLQPRDNAVANLIRSGVMLDGLKTLGIFHAECLDKYGRVKWRDSAPNVVTTEGKNNMLDQYLGRGTAYAEIVLGLHTTVGNAASTYASPSPQVEVAAGVVALRIRPTWGVAAAGAKSNTSSPTSFPVIGTAAPASTTGITGCFLATGVSGITAPAHIAGGGTTSFLISTGSFSVARPVVSGDTLNVTYTLSLT
jgi:hypothetical protein